MSVTLARFERMCVEAEMILRACGPGAPAPSTPVMRDYGMYRLGDDDFLAVGLSWIEPSGEARSAKIQGGAVTDHYVVYGRNGPIFSEQVDPVTREVLARYLNVSDVYEPKVDPKTGEVLQPNYYTHWASLPAHYLSELRRVRFPYLEQVYCWADKPYGSCVEFSII